MKLEDIKAAVRHSCEVNFQRCMYDCAAHMAPDELKLLFGRVYNEIYEDEKDESESAGVDLPN